MSTRRTKQPTKDRLTGWPRPKQDVAKSIGLNPVRMGVLILLAGLGLAGGYYVGKYVNPAPVAPQAGEVAEKPANYEIEVEEEPLPENVVIDQGDVLKRLTLPEIDITLDTRIPAENGRDSGRDLSENTAPSGQDIGAQPETSPDQLPSETASRPEAEQDLPEAAAPPASNALPENLAELQQTASDDLPAWQRHAVPVAPDGRPQIVIVIDDLGVSKPRTRRTVALPGPLTMAFLAYAEDLNAQAKTAREAGHELMLHVPMEPRSTAIDPGPNVLLSGLPAPELRKSIAWNLDQISGIVGINNHMGSRFTSDRDSMDLVTAELRTRGLMFLDSVTSSNTVAHTSARAAGIPYAVRNIFLDHENDLDAVRTQLNRVERFARRNGVAIAIGHPREATLTALETWLPTLEEKGFQLVPISAVAKVAGGS